jgi:hypothetical protein
VGARGTGVVATSPHNSDGMTTMFKIPKIIKGKDGRGRTLLLQIKTVKSLKREKFLPL